MQQERRRWSIVSKSPRGMYRKFLTGCISFVTLNFSLTLSSHFSYSLTLKKFFSARCGLEGGDAPRGSRPGHVGLARAHEYLVSKKFFLHKCCFFVCTVKFFPRHLTAIPVPNTNFNG